MSRTCQGRDKHQAVNAKAGYAQTRGDDTADASSVCKSFALPIHASCPHFLQVIAPHDPSHGTEYRSQAKKAEDAQNKNCRASMRSTSAPATATAGPRLFFLEFLLWFLVVIILFRRRRFRLSTARTIFLILLFHGRPPALWRRCRPFLNHGGGRQVFFPHFGHEHRAACRA